MADASAKVVLDLDNAEFVKRLRESMGLLEAFGAGESLSGLTSTFLQIGSIVGVATASMALFKGSLDSIVEGEKLIGIKKTFENIAASVGVAADVMKNDLIKATRGMVSESELLKAGSQAMVTLGQEAGKIPAIMEVARKATKIFGGELIQNFETFSTAIASGNTRALRQFGIFIENDKAIKAYAKSIGTTSELLSEHGRKVAISNAALEQAKVKFDGVAGAEKPVTNALTKMKIAWGELGESVSKSSARSAASSTGFFNTLITASTDVAKMLKTGWVKMFGSDLDVVEDRLPKVTSRMDYLKKSIEGLKADKTPGMETFNATILKNYNDELAKLTTEYDQLSKKDKELKKEAGIVETDKKTGKTDEERAQESIDQDKRKDLVNKFNADVLAVKQQALQASIGLMDEERRVDEAHAQEKLYIEQEMQQKIEQMHKQFAGIYAADSQEMANLELAVIEQKNARIAQLDKELENKRINALENYANNAKHTQDGIAAGWTAEAAKSTRSLNINAETGKKAFHIIGDSAANAFIEMGKGTKSAGEIMRMFMFGALADIAEASGRMHLLKGIAEYSPTETAAGAGLLALSGVLRGMAGGGASSGGGGGVGGGSAASADIGAGPAADTTKPETKPQEQKSVTVQIQGNYYETEQTRTRLMEMIRESGDFTDFNLRQIGK